MDTVQNPAAEKLYKKLAALRVTLPDDERDVFDQIIPGEEEVTAHMVRRPMKRAKKTVKAPEVTAHMVRRPTKRAKKTVKAPEVTAHAVRRPTKKTTKQTTKKTTK